MTTQQYFYSLRTGVNRRRDSICVRAGNAVIRGGYTTMEELCAATESDILRIRNVGETCARLILEERQKYMEANRQSGI